MTTETIVSPPSTTAARRYSEQIHALVDRQTRELIIGLAVLDAEAGDYARPREGETIRNLLDEAISRLFRRDAEHYARAVRAGRRELARRAAEAAAVTA